MDEAIEWASRQAKVLGDVEIDIRPVTEPWDIGMAPRPERVTTRRYMALRKATAASEAGVPLSPTQRAEMARLIDETTRTGVHLATETMRPSARGRRYKNSRDGVSMTDGPFTESKELIAGYVMRVGGVAGGRGAMGRPLHRRRGSRRGGPARAGVGRVGPSQLPTLSR